MQIVVYTATDAPAGFECVAHIINEQPGKPGKPWVLGFHPVVFRAPTATAAREIAQSWWDAELKKAADKIANGQAMSIRMKNRKAA